MKRIFSSRRKSRYVSGRTNLIGIVILVSILTSVILFFTNERRQLQVLKSFCGDFGFYGKSLVLMRDSTFRFSYHGCSQENGTVTGKWSANRKNIAFSPKYPDDNLDTQYTFHDNELIPVNKPREEKFTICKYYRSP